MARLTIEELLEATGGTLLLGDRQAAVTGIETDSRKVKEGDLFIPVIGERVDGHRFIISSLEAGGTASFTSRHKSPEEARAAILEAGGSLENAGAKAWIAVEDTVAALQAVGRCCRSRLKIPVIGVTGSVGKTTNREMIACALTGGFAHVFKTPANHNSQVGVPITLFEIGPQEEIAVLELGMSEPGEMTRIAGTAQVDMAAVTNIGIAHIGQLGSQENICKEKLAIQDGMKEGGILFLNGDDPILKRQTAKEGCKTLYYGTGENCQYRAVDLHEEDGFPAFTLSCPDGEAVPVKLRVLGTHNVLNAALAIAVAKENGVDPKAAARALEGYSGYKGRQQIFETGALTVIDDSYNASPASMKAGLEVLMAIHPGRRKVAVLADMKELGDQEIRYHREIGSYLADHEGRHMADQIVLLGALGEEIGTGLLERCPEAGEKIHTVPDKEALEKFLETFLEPGDCVLFKGSNSMGLGSVAERFSKGRN